MMTVGDNSINAGQLRTIVERIERLHEERKAIGDHISEVFKEAKANGFDVPALRDVLKRRRMDPDKRVELETIADLYWSHLAGAK
jgi:uncharacterized protein (UPF0335 family)